VQNRPTNASGVQYRPANAGGVQYRPASARHGAREAGAQNAAENGGWPARG